MRPRIALSDETNLELHLRISGEHVCDIVRALGSLGLRIVGGVKLMGPNSMRLLLVAAAAVALGSPWLRVI